VSTDGSTARRPLKTIAGVIERITYQNEANGYTIARLAPERGELAGAGDAAPGSSRARGDDNLITIVGNLVGVAPGEALELTGLWLHNAQYGWQFKVENYRSVLPATAQGIRKYLGSGLIKGVGPKTADKIVAHFDASTLDVLDTAPERLREVPGLGAHKIKLIRQAWAEQKAIKEVMVFLQGHNISTSLAVRIYKHYGDASISVVRNEPYRLARDVWGIGFKTADKIAQAMGIPHDHPDRLKTGALYALSQAGDSEGHTYLPRQKLIAEAAELLGVDPPRVEAAIDALLTEEGAKTDSGPAAQSLAGAANATDRIAEPRVRYDAGHDAGPAHHPQQPIYLPPFYYAEQGIASHLYRLASCEPARSRLALFQSVNTQAMFDYLAKTSRLDLTEQQRAGVVMALRNPVSILTGGPGTGKTTSIRGLIHAVWAKKKRIILAAPTGRAAKRLTETTGLEAKTLHRLLELKPGGDAAFNQRNPLPADLLIVDEVSMIDTLLMNTLLKAVATGTHVLMVGDADQLPSVGAGNVLADLIASGAAPVTQLSQIFRQGEGSAIITNAHRINQGEMPISGPGVSDFFIFKEDDPDKIADLVVDLVTRRIPARFGLAPGDIQALSPSHRGACGVAALNERLQSVLNPAAAGQPERVFGGRAYRVGDRVLQLRNNYDREVFNGDTGVIRAIRPEAQTVSVRLDEGRDVEYGFMELDELALAYAISVHKSQGSEYPACVIPLTMQHYPLLERKLIYTAVTRARRLVVLVGSMKALAIAVRNGPLAQGGDDAPQGALREGGRFARYTGLRARLAARASPRDSGSL